MKILLSTFITLALSSVCFAQDMSGMMMGQSTTNVKDAYSFQHNVKLQIEVYENGKATQSEELTFLFSNDQIIGMELNDEGNSNMIIMDSAELQMVTLLESEGQKIGVTTSLEGQHIGQTNDTDNADFSFEKTGKKKRISGFACEEYLLKDNDETETHKLWMSKDVSPLWMEAMSEFTLGQNSIPGSSLGADKLPEGGVVQIVMEDSKGEILSVTTVNEYNLDQVTEVKTTGYMFMNMPQGMQLDGLSK